jgi:hypothetical protein
MSLRAKLVIAVALVAAATVGAAVGRAQLRQDPVTPIIVQAPNMAFEIIGSNENGVPVGHIMIRKDANSPWNSVEIARSEAGVRRLN